MNNVEYNLGDIDLINLSNLYTSNKCGCGCGQYVKYGNTYIHNHHTKNKPGRKVPEEEKQKSSNYHKNKWKDIEFRNRIIFSMKQTHNRLDVKLKKSEISKKQWNDPVFYNQIIINRNKPEAKKKIVDICISKYGVDNYSKTPAGRLLHRISSIKRRNDQLFNDEPLIPCIGSQERACLNELQQHTQYNIIRNDSSFRYIVGRFPDGHILESKLFIQFDERSHFKNNSCTTYKDDDINCTLELASLGYKVFRISEKQWKENKDQVIEQFKTLTGENK